MTELTRNQSADRLKHIWSTIVEEAPGSTSAIQQIGAMPYVVDSFDIIGVHSDHLAWLWPRLSNQLVELPNGRTIVPLDEIERFAGVMRAAGPGIDAPWRDEEEEPESEPLPVGAMA